MNVLVIDVGGTNVKSLATGQDTPRKFASGPKLTPQQMVDGVKKTTEDWNYKAVSIGYPGFVVRGRPIAEPANLGKGWMGFDFAKAFNLPVNLINDAAMQALGSYNGGKMLFLGLGTGLGTAMVVDGIIEPMELGHLPHKKDTYEHYLGKRGLERMGKKKWLKHVEEIVEILIEALQPTDTVLGGGNAKLLKEIPPHCRLGDNANAFTGGFRLWEKTASTTPRKSKTKKKTATKMR